jgi:U6 snRNA-associated Sm-like protein LSm1
MVCFLSVKCNDIKANIVLEDTVERIFVGNKYCEKPLGIFIIRGENVELLSEIVCF